MEHSVQRIEAEWRAKHPELPLDEILTLIALHRTSQKLLKDHDQFLAGFGLNFAAADVLLSLYRSAPPEGLTLAKLASVMAVTAPAMTARVDRLMESGWITKDSDPEDRRAFKIRLTPEGVALVQKMFPLHIQDKQKTFERFTREEIQTLRELLVRLLGE
ncbi:MarR family winged helix-turn-helix transcriptional regulator [Deinococcus cellulosilyticus]|uniref:MarR family transcriptional regulator n=1 Tax=Deinococcus cellulosilyticus (strain DSM 18568 / NBRC 106333 / KACC 11606 / 5516J-15) TaxID=1223518 RepID=A0A511N4E2_DEIC1|nr:MarR family transcriptional regulator [Deinococcus cellulosilyticus]GEM47744.1 MarR family transcriptional regulator [Deinococcus cellulosilyticus NBRC 106333 = KACC 11606]